MKLKKAVSLGLACVLALSLAGCGGSKKEEASKGMGKIDDKIIKEGTISVYVPQGKNQTFLEEVTKIYNEKNGTDIKLNITNVTPGAATTQMLSPMLVSGEVLPDLMFIQDMSVTGLLEQFPDGFASATEYGFYEKYEKEFLPEKVDALKNMTDGKAVGFPLDWGTVVAYYQIEAFEKAGIKYEEIKSWDDLIEAGKIIKEKTGMKLMTLNETGEIELLLVLMEQQGVSLLDKDGNVNLATKEAKKAMEIIQKLIDNDLIEWYAGDNQEKMYQEVALIITGGWYASNMEMNFPDAKGKWCVSTLNPFSAENAGKNPISGGSSWYIGKNSKNAAIAAQLITFAVTDKDALEKAVEVSLISSNLNAFDTEAANKEFEYYNNQKLNQIFKTAVSNSVGANLFSTVSDARSFGAAATYQAWTTKDIDKSLEKAANEFAEKYSVKVNK